MKGSANHPSVHTWSAKPACKAPANVAHAWAGRRLNTNTHAEPQQPSEPLTSLTAALRMWLSDSSAQKPRPNPTCGSGAGQA